MAYISKKTGKEVARYEVNISEDVAEILKELALKDDRPFNYTIKRVMTDCFKELNSSRS